MLSRGRGGIAPLSTDHRLARTGRRTTLDRAAQPRRVARQPRSEPAQCGASACRRRARAVARSGARAVSRRSARVARHARYAARHGRDLARHRHGAAKRIRSDGDPRIAFRARDGAGLRVRHVDRGCRDIRDARPAVGAVPSRASSCHAATRREDRDDTSRLHAGASTRRNVRCCSFRPN